MKYREYIWTNSKFAWLPVFKTTTYLQDSTLNSCVLFVSDTFVCVVLNAKGKLSFQLECAMVDFHGLEIKWALKWDCDTRCLAVA